MRRRFLVLALLAPLSLHAQGAAAGGARPISLDEAVRLAQQNAPSAVQARGQIRSSDAAIRTVYGSFMPSLSVSYGSNRQGGETFFQGQLVPFRGDPWNFNRGLNSSLELFDGGRRLFNLRSARANLSAAESNDRLQKFRVALDVKQQFFNVLAARESRAAAQAQLAQAEEQLKAATARVRAGAATVSDSLRSVIQVGNAQLALSTAENTLRVRNANLTRLVATSFEVTAEEVADAAMPRVTIDSVEIANTIESAPSVMQAKAELTAAGAALRASKTPYLPTLNVSYSLSGSRTDKTFDITGGEYARANALRFSLQYPIFNGFTREENVARASVAENNAQAQLRDARLAAQQQLTQFIGALRLAQERATIQVASVAAAEEDLRVQNQRYALGSSTLLDVLTSQTQLNSARLALIQARYDARVAKAQIEALVGRDLP
ncbi:MAG: TolC family protein [Gemmatimonadota bacterium]